MNKPGRGQAVKTTEDNATLGWKLMTKCQLAKIFIESKYDTFLSLRTRQDMWIFDTGRVTSNPCNIVTMFLQGYYKITWTVLIGQNSHDLGCQWIDFFGLKYGSSITQTGQDIFMGNSRIVTQDFFFSPFCGQ